MRILACYWENICRQKATGRTLPGWWGRLQGFPLRTNTICVLMWWCLRKWFYFSTGNSPGKCWNSYYLLDCKDTERRYLKVSRLVGWLYYQTVQYGRAGTFRIEAILSCTWVREIRKATSTRLVVLLFDTRNKFCLLMEKQTKLTRKNLNYWDLLCAHANEILQRDFALKLFGLMIIYFNARSMDVYITKLPFERWFYRDYQYPREGV